MNKNILIVVFSKTLSGAEKRIARLFIEMTNRNIPVKLCLLSEMFEKLLQDPEFRHRFSDARFSELCIVIKREFGVGLWGFFKRTIYVCGKLWRHKPDTIHTFLGARSVWYKLFFPFSDITFEITSPDIADSLQKTKSKWLMWQISRYMSVSPSVTRRLLEGGSGIYWKRKEANGLLWTAPIPFFTPSPEIQGEIKMEEKENTIVYASRFIERKNVHIFAEGVCRFLKMHPDWNCRILGKGPCEEKIKCIIREHGQDAKVQVGHVPTLVSVLLKSKIFVSIIQPDNYPSQSVLEAMSCGNALLLSNTGDSHRFLDTESNNGVLVDISADSVCVALAQLAGDLDRLREMGESASVFSRKSFSPNVFIEDFLNFLNVETRCRRGRIGHA